VSLRPVAPPRRARRGGCRRRLARDSADACSRPDCRRAGTSSRRRSAPIADLAQGGGDILLAGARRGGRNRSKTSPRRVLRLSNMNPSQGKKRSARPRDWRAPGGRTEHASWEAGGPRPRRPSVNSRHPGGKALPAANATIRRHNTSPLHGLRARRPVLIPPRNARRTRSGSRHMFSTFRTLLAAASPCPSSRPRLRPDRLTTVQASVARARRPPSPRPPRRRPRPPGTSATAGASPRGARRAEGEPGREEGKAGETSAASPAGRPIRSRPTRSRPSSTTSRSRPSSRPRGGRRRMPPRPRRSSKP